MRSHSNSKKDTLTPQRTKTGFAFLVEVAKSSYALLTIHRILKNKGIQAAISHKFVKASTSYTPQSDISRSVNWAAKLLPYTTCLAQALTAKKRLEQNGYECHFRIGVRKLGRKLDAHAWIEGLDGTVLCPLRDVRPFTIFENDITELGNIQWN